MTARRSKPRRLGRTLLRIAGWGALACALALCALVLSLPSVESLPARVHVGSTRFVDRQGQLLYEVIDPSKQSGGLRERVPLAAIAPSLRDAVVAVEDESFYTNPGVDVRGIVRAVWLNIQSGETVSGGSTITQQLARLAFLDEDERTSRSLLRKVREGLLALLMGARYSKDEILTFYLNEVYFGNLAYGAEAASRVYFGKSARDLDVSEASMLAGLLQNPVAYDPLNHPEAARARQSVVLDLMVKHARVAPDQADIARATRLSFGGLQQGMQAPHAVAYARSWAEERFGVEAVARGGLVITLTIDSELNRAAEQLTRERLAQLRAEPEEQQRPYGYNANNAAVIVLDPHNGDILAMVGSPDYFDRSISGAVNATIALRQPGSAIKPVTYAAAFETVAGFTAATPLLDVPRAFPTREGLPYLPENYNRQFGGPISVRDALATSNNVAAVATLQQVGLTTMLDFGRRLGLRTLGSEDGYGLSLTLGGGEVRLLDLTTAFAAFAREGVPVEPAIVLAVSDTGGALLYRRSTAPGASAAMSPLTAWLISDILSDNAARAPAFGENSALRLARPAAVKTGTTTDWRDNWAVGYTPDLVVGAWVGNASGEPMTRISGVTGAAPLWHDVMEVGSRNLAVRGFERPTALRQVEICTLSGLLPTPECQGHRREWFVPGTEPQTRDTWIVRVNGQLRYRLPELAVPWAREHGWPLDDAAIGGDAGALRLARPLAGAQYRMASDLPASAQRMLLAIAATDLPVVAIAFSVDGASVAQGASALEGVWALQPGAHVAAARVTLADGRNVDVPGVPFVVLP